MWEAIQDRLTRRNYDVVHFFGGVQVYEFRNLVVGSLPSIIVPYESYSLYLQRARALAQSPPDRLKLWAMSIMARRYESVMYGGFGRVVTVTEGDSACLRSLAPDLSTTVIPNGVDGSFFRQVGASDRPPSLVFVGNMSYPPNVLAALALIREILPRVKSEVTDARAIIVGPQPPAELTCLRGPDVEISGWVADIRPYLERSGCFVSPLTGGTGMRNKILEAMAMGLPVVATPMSCEGIKVTHGEDILLGRTPEELARAAICLLRDPSLSVRIAEGGQRLMREHHTWASVADQYEVLYDEVRSEWRLGRVGRGAVGRTRDVEDPGDHPRLQ
jgi:glycosyltransferase involved in cell wall biosynthesis